MPTPKPGQIRCPTCHRPTPMAAFCTQCGAAIPTDAQVRPRGLNREELDARIRQRRPGDRPRRGTPFEAGAGPPPGYVPFEPDAQDARALRESAEEEHRVDNTAPDFDQHRAQLRRQAPPPPDHDAQPGYAGPPPYEESPYEVAPESEPAFVPPPPPAWEEPASYAGEAEPAAPYDGPEDAYSYWEAEEPRRSASSMLPIVGFIGLAILALGIGAALAAMFGGGVADTSATPSPSLAATTSIAPSVEATASEGEASATPEPSDGPVAFPDGAELSVQPCGKSDFDQDAVGRPEADACKGESSTIKKGEVWAFIVFAHTPGSDTLTVQLMQQGQVQNEQKLTIDTVLGGCGSSCNGLVFGAHYVGLFPGDYRLVLERNGAFADSASFTVE